MQDFTANPSWPLSMISPIVVTASSIFLALLIWFRAHERSTKFLWTTLGTITTVGVIGLLISVKLKEEKKYQRLVAFPLFLLLEASASFNVRLVASPLPRADMH